MEVLPQYLELVVDDPVVDESASFSTVEGGWCVRCGTYVKLYVLDMEKVIT